MCVNLKQSKVAQQTCHPFFSVKKRAIYSGGIRTHDTLLTEADALPRQQGRIKAMQGMQGQVTRATSPT